MELEASRFRESDPSKASAIYERGLKNFPDSHELHNNYANFLTDVRKDHDRAEELYQRALELDPDDAVATGNYAGFVLALGRTALGMELVSRAMALHPPDPLRVELLFYVYAHGTPADRAQALGELHALLDKGVRSPGWDLSANVARAAEDGHENPGLLRELAAIIAEEASSTGLNESSR
ncbi:MAG: tetratricopeptide repeat protein [Candidatus Bipolaricaulota bacterium]